MGVDKPIFDDNTVRIAQAGAAAGQEGIKAAAAEIYAKNANNPSYINRLNRGVVDTLNTAHEQDSTIPKASVAADGSILITPAVNAAGNTETGEIAAGKSGIKPVIDVLRKIAGV